MEYSCNGELFDYIKQKGKLCESEASKIFAQILLGIEYLHKMGIVHRDINLT